MYTNTVCIIWTVSSKGQLPALRNSLKLLHGLFEQSNVQHSLKAAYDSRHGKKCFPSYVHNLTRFFHCKDICLYNEKISSNYVHKKESIFCHGDYHRLLLENVAHYSAQRAHVTVLMSSAKQAAGP